MSTQIEILLKARDEATKQIQTAFKSAEQSLNQFNTVAGQTGKTLSKAGKDVSGFNQYMKEGRIENRQFGFVMREVMDIVGGAALMIKLFGGNSTESQKEAKRLSEAVLMGYIAFQAIETVMSVVKVGMDALKTSTVLTTAATNTLEAAQIRLGLIMKKIGWAAIVAAIATVSVTIYSYIAAAEKAEFVTNSLAHKQKALEEAQKILTNHTVIGTDAHEKQKIVVKLLQDEYNKLTEAIKEKTYVAGSEADMDEQLKNAQLILQAKLKMGTDAYYEQVKAIIILKNKIDLLKKGIIELEGIETTAPSQEFLKKQLDDYQESLKSKEQRTTEYFDNLIKLENQYSADKNKIAKLSLDKEKALHKIKLEEYAELLQVANQAVGLMLGFSNQASEQQISNISRERDLRLEAINKELEAEGLSEEQKTILLEKKQVIEQEANEKIRKEKKRAFENQKKASIIEAIINTAVSLTKSLAYPWMAPMIQALGAAQIALIASQPVPSFHKGGTAFVNAPSSSEGFLPIKVRGQETIRVNTESQERNRGGSVTINFNSPVSDTQFITNSIKKVLNQSGLSLEKAFVNQRNVVSL